MTWYKKWGLAFLMLSIIWGLTACHKETADAPVQYEKISAAQAMELMEKNKGYLLLDTRTEEEFAQGHIAGAKLIPEYEIEARAPKELLDKDQLILVYCRSGRRSKIAAAILVDLGYTNVREFGGIIDWPYEIVK